MSPGETGGDKGAAAQKFERLGRGDVRRLLESRDLGPVKSLGQHFVTDPNTVDRIARLAGIGPGDLVVEIGAGLGSLTLALVSSGAEVTAIEIDRRLVELLEGLLPQGVRVVQADALACDWQAVLPGGPWTLVANLPYNVAIPLVVQMLQRAPQIERMLVMVQKEAGERLAATPGGREYGAVSVRVAYFAAARVVGRVAPEVFHPRPRVASVLVSIERRPEPAVPPEVASYGEIDRLLRAGFGGRRKMLRRSLAGLVTDGAFDCAGVAPQSRAEELGVVEWGKLARCQRSITGTEDGSSPTPS